MDDQSLKQLRDTGCDVRDDIVTAMSCLDFGKPEDARTLLEAASVKIGKLLHQITLIEKPREKAKIG